MTSKGKTILKIMKSTQYLLFIFLLLTLKSLLISPQSNNLSFLLFLFISPIIIINGTKIKILNSNDTIEKILLIIADITAKNPMIAKKTIKNFQKP